MAHKEHTDAPDAEYMPTAQSEMGVSPDDAQMIASLMGDPAVQA